ncbi:Ig-like domain-containing protein [Alistipes sp.]|uniref:Ig-like domain-containing protein n=1 Tax=Alistipes sp. TaxID=1872444 RepID=UPI003AF07DE9
MKNLSRYLFCLLATGLICAGCDESPTEEGAGTIRVESISLNTPGNRMTLIRTRTFQLEATVFPENAADREFSWFSAHPEIASVSETGLVTALTEGETILGAVAHDGGKRAVVRLTVTKYIAEVPITAISLDHSEHDFSSIADPPLQLVATIRPAEPTMPLLAWSSDDPFVVQVDADGCVRIVGGGTATVRASAVDGGDAFAACRVSVPGTAIKDRNYDSVGTIYADDYYKIVYEPVTITVPVLDEEGNPAGTTTQTWLDRNLGARRRAVASDDHEAFGSLFQWSRKADGHEKIVWTLDEEGYPLGTPATGTRTEQAASREDAGHADFIVFKGDWSTDKISAGGLWGGKTFSVSSSLASYATHYGNLTCHAPLDDPAQANNPCPYGYRVPTVMELHQLMMAASGTETIVFNGVNTAAGIGQTLSEAPYFLPCAGDRAYANGSLTKAGTWAILWTNSAQTAANGYPMRVDKAKHQYRISGIQRAVGSPVRCIKD